MRISLAGRVQWNYAGLIIGQITNNQNAGADG